MSGVRTYAEPIQFKGAIIRESNPDNDLLGIGMVAQELREMIDSPFEKTWRRR